MEGVASRKFVLALGDTWGCDWDLQVEYTRERKGKDIALSWCWFY